MQADAEQQARKLNVGAMDLLRQGVLVLHAAVRTHSSLLFDRRHRNRCSHARGGYADRSR